MKSPFLSPTLRPFFQTQSGTILVVGDVMLDRYWRGSVQRVAPENKAPILHLQEIQNRAGGAGHVAMGINALNQNAILIALIGDDLEAQIFKDTLTLQHHLIEVNNHPTITKHRIGDSEHTLVRVDSEQSFKNCTAAHEELRRIFEQQISMSTVLVLSDYNKGTLIDSAWMIDIAKQKNIPVLVDPKGDDFSKYRGASLIKPNWDEFESVVGPCLNLLELEDKAQILIKQYDFGAILLTKNADGFFLFEAEQKMQHYASSVTMVRDVTGAGDTVLSILASTMALDIPISKAIPLASYAASIAISRPGTALVSLVDLKPKIVFTNGCFDVLHAGHILFLQKAKELGEYLIVGINDDDSISRIKGITRPINSLENRMRVLNALSCVDEIIPFSQDTPENLIRQIRPDVLTKGGDYSDIDALPGAQFVQSYGGDVQILGFYENLSSTKIISKLNS